MKISRTDKVNKVDETASVRYNYHQEEDKNNKNRKNNKGKQKDKQKDTFIKQNTDDRFEVQKEFNELINKLKNNKH